MCYSLTLNRFHKNNNIMKKIIYTLFLSFFLIGFSQQKELSIDDAVLGYSKGLYPSTLKNLHWVGDSNLYVFEKNNSLVFTESKSAKINRTLE